MKALVLHSAFLALLGLILSPLAVADASSPPAAGVPFCAPFDYEQWRGDHPRPAAKRLLLVTAGVQESEGQLDPPFSGTVWIDPDIITPSDPTAFEDITAAGRGERTMFDRRVEDWITVNAYLFNAQFDDGLTAEIQVNTEFGSTSAAQAEANKYGRAIGQLPTVLRTNVETVWIHKGDHLWGGGNNNILIHVGMISDWRKEFLEEVLVHEAAHTSLDATHSEAPDWIAAQEADGNYISTYARDYPKREDIAESFLPYMAVRYRSTRISLSYEQTILKTMPNRIAYFDAQSFDDMYPITMDVTADQPFEWPPELVACPQPLYEPDSNGEDQWVNLKPYNPSQLSRLSISAGDDTEIIFVNNSTTEVLFYWLDYDRTERYYGRVAACGFSTQSTFAGQIWLIKDQHGKNLAVFQAEEKTGRAFIGSAQANTLTETSDEDQQGGAPHTLEKISGDEQQGPVGTALAAPFVVSVLDEDGSAIAGAVVMFSVTAGEGTLSATTATTDANGRARSTLTLVPGPGTNTVVATISGLEPETFTATAIEQTPHSLTKVSGDGQEGLAGVALAAPFVVSVLDEDGAAVIGAVVTFSVTAGGGILSATTATTDANGQAATTLTLTLGSDTETNTVEATVEGLEPVTFTVTAVGQATPDSLAKVSGDGQEGMVGEALAEPFVVSVLDEDGAAIAGAVVTFSVTAGGGTLSAITVTTDANGRARSTLTLGSEPGTNTVAATVAGLESETFTAIGQATTDSDGDDEEADGEEDSEMAFGFAEEVEDQAYTAGAAISALVLPEATDGEGEVTYRVSDLPTGLSFDAATRTISGTPEVATDGAVEVTYTAQDSAGAAATLTFSITVNPALSFGDLFDLFN